MKKFVSPYGATARRNFVLVMLLIFATTVLGRVVYLQVGSDDFFISKGNMRFIRTKKEPALRGSVVDRNQVPLAVSTPVSSLWLETKEIAGSVENIYQLAASLNLPQKQFERKIQKVESNRKRRQKQEREKPKKERKKISGFMYLRRGMEPAVANKILEKNIPGVYSMREYRRFYPSADITSQIIGFNGIDDRGQEGIELMFNDWLSGTSGSSEVIRDPSGRVVHVLQEIRPPVQGQNLTLTIDKRIQYLTYMALLETTRKFSAKAATAVMLDAKTSEVLAMVSVPSGNPNNSSERKASLVKNRAITDTFEPGSVVKPLAVASALNARLVNPMTPVDTKPGRLRLGKNTVKDVHNYGRLNVSGVIKKSSNVGTCKIALRVPRQTLYTTYRALGFGQKSRIDFTGEQKGRLNNFDRLSDFDYCTRSYGYGISTTALQLAQAYAILANDGVKVPVSLIKQEGVSEGERVFSQRTAKQVRKMLYAAVEKDGTGNRATRGEYMQDYSVGGKTGTVHKVINGRYADNRYRSVFAGIAPIDKPQVVMVVMVDDPKGDKYYGGLVAAPVFAKVVGKTLRMLGVEPDKKNADTAKIIHAATN